MKLVNNYELFNTDGVFICNRQQLSSNHTRTELYWSKRPSNRVLDYIAKVIVIDYTANAIVIMITIAITNVLVHAC